MKPKTITGSLRFTTETWQKLRDLLRHRGKEWFCKWVDREHKKLEAE